MLSLATSDWVEPTRPQPCVPFDLDFYWKALGAHPVVIGTRLKFQPCPVQSAALRGERYVEEAEVVEEEEEEEEEGEEDGEEDGS